MPTIYFPCAIRGVKVANICLADGTVRMLVCEVGVLRLGTMGEPRGWLRWSSSLGEAESFGQAPRAVLAQSGLESFLSSLD